MDDLVPVLVVYKLNDKSYLVECDFDTCDDKNDSLIMSYKEKSSEEEVEDDLVVSAIDEKAVAELVLKYLPLVKVKSVQEITKTYEDLYNSVKV